jgi:peroxiredoxin
MKPGLITPGELAPDFRLSDVRGGQVSLSEFRDKKIVLLAFLRGFL